MKTFYFTFGVGQKILKNYYVKIEAFSEKEAREIMFKNFGSKWAFCYTDFNLIKKYNLKELTW